MGRESASPINTATPMQRSLILELATEVRAGLLELSKVRHPAVRRVERFKAEYKTASVVFPHGWCDVATCVLAHHIARETSSEECELIIGQVPFKWEFHWWLRVHGYLVDITCDQFEGAPACPFVELESDWHASKYPEPIIRDILMRDLQSEDFERALAPLTCSLYSVESVRHAMAVRTLCRAAGEEDRERGHEPARHP